MRLSIFVVGLTVAVCVVAYEDVTYDPKAIAEDIDRATKPFSRGYANQEVCYEHVGCFSKVNGTFAFLAVQPESPEIINTGFHLYSRHNKETPIELSYTDTNTLSTGFFEGSKSTIVIIHGFNEHAKKEWNLKMKDNFLEMMDANVILVDWGKGAVLPYYGQSIVNSELVARQLVILLELLQDNRGLSIERVHLLGYSLGAHLAGLTGKILFKKHGKKLARISGMDPAGPIFEEHGEDVHLSPNDANFVDVVHSSAGGNYLFGELGITKAIGHVDFYPNGGKDQPGCGFFEFTCSHRRGVLLYLDSMNKDCQMQGFPCTSYKDYTAEKCTSCDTGCSILGFYSLDYSGRGSLYLETKSETPFCNEI